MFFGLVREEMNADALAVVRSASGLIASWQRRPDDPWAPGLLWDLDSTSNVYILHRIRDLPIRLASSGRDDRRDIAVNYRGDANRPWMLFVDDTTALELIRRSDLTTVADTMWFLLRRGTRIAIAARMPPLHEQEIPRAPMPLGWRTGAFKKDGWEYKEYEHSV